jgi:hypothetical protein
MPYKMNFGLKCYISSLNSNHSIGKTINQSSFRMSKITIFKRKIWVWTKIITTHIKIGD